MVNDVFGSNSDSRRGCLPRPELEVERKQSGDKQTSLMQCPKLGVEQTYLGHGRNFSY